MTHPVYKVEFWAPSAGSSRYSLTSDVLSIYTKDVLTEGVGNFTVVLPTTKNGSNYLFNDIARNDTVKIWLGYNAISGNPNFIGKVTKTLGSLDIEKGYIRQVGGLSQGEILLRRQKTNTWWIAADASTIATSIANDLSLGTSKIEIDTTDVTLKVETKRYFDILREISDYWYDANNKIQKDFWVDLDGDLVWTSRDGTPPFRSGTGVEALTVGENILGYTVNRDIESMRNNIIAYGLAERTNPSDRDAWTESTTNWSSALGATIIRTGADGIIGSWSIQGTLANQVDIDMSRSFSSVSFKYEKDYKLVHFWFKCLTTSGDATRLQIRLESSLNNYYHTFIENLKKDEWNEVNWTVGPDSDALSIGNPDWTNISKITFIADYDAFGDLTMRIDNLYLGKARFIGSAANAAGQVNSTRRDLEVIDDRLTSDSACSKRANALLMQKGTEPIEVEVTVNGNTNILLGDRIPLTIPAEGISPSNYDVVGLEHSLDENVGFRTKATLMNSPAIRLPVTMNRSMVDAVRKLQSLGRGERQIF